MQKSRANLARIAARASSRTTPITIPAHLRTPATFHGTGPIRKSHALAMTGAQRDSRGRMSDWSRSAEIGGSLGSVTKDSKWSQTVQNQNVGG